MKQETIRIIALVFMLILAVAIFFVYREVKYYNDFIKETGRSPCAFCQEINPDIICQKVDTTNKENHPCKQCKELGYGILGYVE